MEAVLPLIAYERRLDVLEVVKTSGAGHIGGCMSCMDILVSLYYGLMDIDKLRCRAFDRDRFILSKGHCAEALYTILADLGFITRETLRMFAAFDSILAEHPTPKIPGVEVATGALGHGLSVGVGMALGLKAASCCAGVYVLMGDGEQAEGSVWEAVMAAGKYKLDNLTGIIDRNLLQISGGTEDIMPMGNLGEKYRAFGWECRLCDGHDPGSILTALSGGHAGKPLVVIAATVKGFGSPVMEGITQWHHQIPDANDYNRIRADLIMARDRCIQESGGVVIG